MGRARDQGRQDISRHDSLHSHEVTRLHSYRGPASQPYSVGGEGTTRSLLAEEFLTVNGDREFLGVWPWVVFHVPMG